MARTVLTYGAKDLNDGITWSLMPGFDPGERIKTYDERRSYKGKVAQYNVTEANLIHMFVPLKLVAANLAALCTARDELNTLIDAGAQYLVFDGVIYSCGHCERVSFVYDQVVVAIHQVRIDWSPVRYP